MKDHKRVQGVNVALWWPHGDRKDQKRVQGVTVVLQKASR